MRESDAVVSVAGFDVDCCHGTGMSEAHGVISVSGLDVRLNHSNAIRDRDCVVSFSRIHVNGVGEVLTGTEGPVFGLDVDCIVSFARDDLEAVLLMVHGNVNAVVAVRAIDSNICAALDVDLVIEGEVDAGEYDIDTIDVDRASDNDRRICVLVDRCLVDELVLSRLGV